MAVPGPCAATVINQLPSPTDFCAHSSIDHITPLGLANSSSSLVEAGALLVVARPRIIRHTMPVGVNAVPVALNQDMKAARLDQRYLLPQFLRRWIQGLSSSLGLAWSKQGATVESLEHEYVANTVLPLPGPPEQKAITAFLDRQTARIDALTEKKQRVGCAEARTAPKSRRPSNGAARGAHRTLREHRSALITAPKTAAHGQCPITTESRRPEHPSFLR
jgi:hypothetical protein